MTFEGPAGSNLTTDHALVARAVERVGERWPAAVPMRESLAGETGERSAVCDALLRAYGANLVQLHVCPPSLSVSPGERPEASPRSSRPSCARS